MKKFIFILSISCYCFNDGFAQNHVIYPHYFEASPESVSSLTITGSVSNYTIDSLLDVYSNINHLKLSTKDTLLWETINRNKYKSISIENSYIVLIADSIFLHKNLMSLNLKSVYFSRRKIYLASKFIEHLVAEIININNPSCFLSSISTLKSLIMINCRLTEIDSIINNNYNLEMIDFSKNGIGRISDNISRLENLKFIVINNNPINYILNQIASLSELKTLILPKNSYTMKRFDNLRGMLSGCRIEFY